MCMEKKLAVIAIGGNSLVKDKDHQTVPDQVKCVEETCVYIVDLIEEGWDVVITHGNGPQVGFILLRSELAKNKLHEVPLDSCGADTQGALGYNLQQALQNEMERRGLHKHAVTVVTQVVVDAVDPSFGRPDKPIGPFYKKEEAEAAVQEKGWAVVEDALRGEQTRSASPSRGAVVRRAASDSRK